MPIRNRAERILFQRFVENERFIDIGIEGFHKIDSAVDPHLVVLQQAKYAINNARSFQRRHALSYRDFRVGASVVALNEKKNFLAIYSGANYKKKQEDPKQCAEMAAGGMARKEGANYPVGVFIVGVSDPELIRQVTGRSTLTLHPCNVCREFLDDSSVVVSTSENVNAYQVHTGREIIDLYQEPNDFTTRRMRRQHELDLPLERLIVDPDLGSFDDAQPIYQELIASYDYQPDTDIRMVRAEAVVRSLLTVAR